MNRKHVEQLAKVLDINTVIMVPVKIGVKEIVQELAVRTGLTTAGACSRFYKFRHKKIDMERLIESREAGMRRRRQSVKSSVGTAEWNALGDNPRSGANNARD